MPPEEQRPLKSPSATDEKGAVEVTVPAPSGVPAAATGDGAEKPRLRVAKSAETPAAGRPFVAQSRADAAAAPAADKQSGTQAGKGFLSRETLQAGLVAVVIVALCLTAVEIGRHARANRLPTFSGGGGPVAAEVASAAVSAAPDFAKVMEAFTTRRFFGGVTNISLKKGSSANWATYVRANMVLLGRSGAPAAAEVVVFDKKGDIPYFWTIGQKVVVALEKDAKQALTVENMGEREVVVTDGIERVPIRPGASVAASEQRGGS